MRMHHQREDLIWGSTLDHNERLVLLCLNSFVDGNGECWPGVERISDMTGLGERTVTRLTTQLAGKGILQKRRRRTSTGLTSNKYKIEFDLIPQRPEKEYKKTLERMEAISQNGGNVAAKMAGAISQNGGNVAAKMADDLPSTRTIQLELSSNKEEVSASSEPDDPTKPGKKDGKPLNEQEEVASKSQTPDNSEPVQQKKPKGSRQDENSAARDRKKKKNELTADEIYALLESVGHLGTFNSFWRYICEKYKTAPPDRDGKRPSVGRKHEAALEFYECVVLKDRLDDMRLACQHSPTVGAFNQIGLPHVCRWIRGGYWDNVLVQCGLIQEDVPDFCSEIVPESQQSRIEAWLVDLGFLAHLTKNVLPNRPGSDKKEATIALSKDWLIGCKQNQTRYEQVKVHYEDFQQKQQQRSTSITQPIAEPLDYIPESPTPVTAPVSREKIEAQKKLLAQRVASNVRVTARVV